MNIRTIYSRLAELNDICEKVIKHYKKQYDMIMNNDGLMISNNMINKANTYLLAKMIMKELPNYLDFCKEKFPTVKPITIDEKILKFDELREGMFRLLKEKKIFAPKGFFPPRKNNFNKKRFNNNNRSNVNKNNNYRPYHKKEESNS